MPTLVPQQALASLLRQGTLKMDALDQLSHRLSWLKAIVQAPLNSGATVFLFQISHAERIKSQGMVSAIAPLAL
jgi:hypothetical protein